MSTRPTPNIAVAPTTKTGSAIVRGRSGAAISAPATTATVATEVVTHSVSSVTANLSLLGPTSAN